MIGIFDINFQTRHREIAAGIEYLNVAIRIQEQNVVSIWGERRKGWKVRAPCDREPCDTGYDACCLDLQQDGLFFDTGNHRSPTVRREFCINEVTSPAGVGNLSRSALHIPNSCRSIGTRSDNAPSVWRKRSG